MCVIRPGTQGRIAPLQVGVRDTDLVAADQRAHRPSQHESAEVSKHALGTTTSQILDREHVRLLRWFGFTDSASLACVRSRRQSVIGGTNQRDVTQNGMLMTGVWLLFRWTFEDQARGVDFAVPGQLRPLKAATPA